jgi:hypothetical protein
MTFVPSSTGRDDHDAGRAGAGDLIELQARGAHAVPPDRRLDRLEVHHRVRLATHESALERLHPCPDGPQLGEDLGLRFF